MCLRWLCPVLLFVTGCQEELPPADDSPEIPPAILPEPSFFQEEIVAQNAGKERIAQLARLGVDRWHRGGYLGADIKVAILDTGFDSFRQRLGRTLPQNVVMQSFRYDGDIKAGSARHGLHCAEIVHALAPCADLLFANWEPDDPAAFLKAVRWARQEGASIITCSVVIPSWGDGEGGGSIQAELSRLLSDDGPLFFASAGNVADRHWSGDFHPGPCNFHEWRPGKLDNKLSPWGADIVSVELTSPLHTEYRAIILDDEGNDVGVIHPVAVAGYRAASVRFIPEKASTYRLRLRQISGQPGPVRVVVLGAGLEWSIAKASVVFPGECPSVIAVGAVSGDGKRLPYSAFGGRSRKPELVAVVPFAGIDSFSGTSAAAPQAAGLAALIWSRFPQRKAAGVRTELFRGSKDIGSPGEDSETSHGVIRLQ